MQQLWDRHPQTAEDLAIELIPAQGWQMPTLKTLLARLLQKGALRAEKDGRRYLYSPTFGREAWLGSQSLSLIDRWFGGGLAPLVAQFASERKLKDEDIKALKQLLKAQGHE